MENWKHHCEILGVAENATLKEVRRAYRKRALLLHPDKHQNSLSSKEEFQRLNESYRYLTGALAKGSRPRPAPRPHQNPAAPAPPSKSVARARFVAPSYLTIWLHAGIACLVLLTISVWLDRREPAPAPIARNDTRDLAIKGWCQIVRVENGGERKEISEFWSQAACEGVCDSTASLYNVGCSWGGSQFRTPRVAAAPIPAPALNPPPTPDPPKIAERVGSPEPVEPAEQVVPYNSVLPATDGVFRSTCFMTVVRPGNPMAQAMPNETEDSCVDHCAREIMAHPLDGIVKCAFAGREVVHHVPDPMASYLARNPAQTGFQQGDSFVANCEIYTTLRGRRVRARAGLTAEGECEGMCEREVQKQSRAAEVSCLYNGQGFLRARGKN